MKFLPPETHPPLVVMPRTHRPARRRFRDYRDCLRWEFGFTCALCLLHEADLDEHAHTEGKGLITVEHYVTKGGSELGASLRDDYSNCVLACRLCNTARGARPHWDSTTGVAMLNPTVDAWGEYFVLRGHKLEPRNAGCHRTDYTLRAYRLNAAAKVEMRATRTRHIREAMLALRDRESERARLECIRSSLGPQPPIEALAELDWVSRLLSAQQKRARATLRRYRPVPDPAPSSCWCDDSSVLVVPSWLEAQLLEVA